MSLEDDVVRFRPLNQELYRILRQHFDSVLIANEGEEMVASRGQGATQVRRAPYGTLAGTRGRLPTGRLKIYSSGEYYRVCCPLGCQDGRHRLWINHMYGQPNSSGYRDGWLAHCFNDGCTDNFEARQRLEEMIFGFRNRNQRAEQFVIQRGERSVMALTQVDPPGALVRLSNLGPQHHANQYLCSRGYDPAFLEHNYNVSYCLSANQEYAAAFNRIFIPIYMCGALVGWQCRYIGDTDWRAVPKYYGLRGMPKKLMLYNYDVATTQPFIVVVEGVTDVWVAGRPAVAILGKSMSGQQARLLTQQNAGKPLILCLDPEARDESAGILQDIQRLGNNPVVSIELPAGRDPGNMEREALWRIIYATARSRGVLLPTLT